MTGREGGPGTATFLAPDQLIEIRGKPQVLRTDNGPEFVGTALSRGQGHGVELLFISKAGLSDTLRGVPDDHRSLLCKRGVLKQIHNVNLNSCDLCYGPDQHGAQKRVSTDGKEITVFLNIG